MIGIAPIDKSKYIFDANVPYLKNLEKETDTLKLFDKVKVSIYASDEYFQNKVMINIISD